MYGERLSSSGSGPQIAFGYTGREHSPDIPLNYNRDRYLDVRGGRWNQPDRFGMVDGLNEYRYAKSNPALLSDPSGRSSYFKAIMFWVAPELYLYSVISEKPYQLHQDLREMIATLPSPDNGDTIDGDIQIAEQHPSNAFWFAGQFKPLGPWDYTPKRSELNPFTQIAYGATGTAVGFPPSVLLRAAGALQVAMDLGRTYMEFFGGGLNPHERPAVQGLGTPLDLAGPYGDDPVDYVFIMLGITYYLTKGAPPCAR